MRTCRHHHVLFVFYCGLMFGRGKIILQEPKNNWKGWNDDFRGTSWLKEIYSGKPVFASCSPGSANEGWLLLPFIDNVPSSVKTLTVKFSFTFRKCSSFTFPPVPCNEQVELLRREENKPVRLSELRRKQFDVAATVTAKQEKMSSVPPVGAGPRSFFSGTVHITGSKGIYLAIKNVASCIALFTFQVSYAGPCTSQGVNLMKLKETVAPESSSTEIEVNGSCVDNAVPTQGSSRLYAICHSSGEWTAGVNASCVCKQGYQQDIDQNKCEGKILIIQEPLNNWKDWVSDFRGTSWSKVIYSGKPVFASCSPGSTTEGWLLLPFIDNVPSSVKTLTVKFSFTFRKCSSFKFPLVACNEQVELLRREENKTVRISQLRQGQFDVASTVTSKQVEMSSVPPVGVGPRSTFSGTVKTGSKGIYLAIKNIASCFALFTFEISYATCPSQGVGLINVKETVAPASGSTVIEVNGSCVDNAVPIQGSSRLYAICHSSGEWTAGVNGSCVCIQGYQQSIDQNKCYECPAGTYKDVAANTMCRACPKNSKPGCLRDECVCKTGYYRVPVDQNETPCEALPPSPKLTVTTVISSTAAFISWFPAPRATRYSVECVMCSKAFTGYCYNCRRNMKFCPSRDSIPGTSVFISGMKPSTFFKFKVFSRNQLNEVVSKGKWNYLQVNLKTKSSG